MEPSDPDSTRRFTDRARAYAQFRPSYPAAAIDAMLAGLPAPERIVAADVGAGTGIATRLLAARGVRVLAVEPNAAMRAAAVPHPLVQWRAGTAAATGIDAACVDLVLVAQAFHWFDPPDTLREFQRILARPGRLAIMWNRRSRQDPFTLGYRTALEVMDAEAPAERSQFDSAVVAAGGRFTDLQTHVVRNAQALTLDELLGRAQSTSTVPQAGPRWDALAQMLRALHASHASPDGRATMVYDTEVYVWAACG